MQKFATLQSDEARLVAEGVTIALEGLVSALILHGLDGHTLLPMLEKYREACKSAGRNNPVADEMLGLVVRTIGNSVLDIDRKI